MTLCFLGLGSNLKSPERQLRQALTSLQKLPRSVMVAQSKLYPSKPWGLKAQPPFCNMVIAIHTSLSAANLLRYCRAIEVRHHRQRKKRWGPRTLDIDILLYGNNTIHTHNLTVPHPNMTSRDFVLLPLLEIAPGVTLPNGQYLASYLKDCENHVYPLHWNSQ